MKRLFIILSVTFSMFNVSCKDDRLELPGVQATPSQLNFTSTHTSENLTLSVTPFLNLQWSVVYRPNWLEFNPASGYVDGSPILVTALTSTLLPQTLTDKIIINTTTGKIEIPVTLNITSSVAIQVTPSPLLIDFNENSKTLTIRNNSNQSVNWQLVPSSAYFNITPASGNLNANQSSSLTLTVDRINLDSKTYNETLALKLGGVQNSNIPVSINNFKEEKWLLSGAITDAEYDRVGDNLIAIIGNKLYKLKPETKSESSVSLSLPGTCVSVGRSGQYAAVGHDAWISLVNLTTMQVTATYPVSCNVLDIVLAPNNWVYAFPKVDQWQNIRCINLADGAEILNSGRQIYAGTKVRLHPSGDYIYGANNGLSPSDAEKYDIRGGRANFLYDSRYHGEYAFSGDLWISDDGSKMYTRGRNVFRLTTDQATDITYAGSLTGTNVGVQALDQISSKNLVYAIFFDFLTQDPQNEVKIFTSDFLNLLGTKPIPGFLVSVAGSYQVVPSQGVFGFFNSTGTKFFVCVRSKTVSASPVQWAIATINVN